ncbi:MAG: hypothetical protein A2X99_04630 [Deltaproteobacteria bacterium GWB2_55_19]|nr:MAG: hypothetical protein A2X99_04630 [Deltaproteobacteria bacterium GWB2_55_19]HAO94171.1 hypothetical protein [Deltaproteobacteria bacterium]
MYEGKGYWNRLKAEWYRRGLDYSTLPKVALSFIVPRTEDAKTFLDVGSGCGTLSIPLARAGKKVTALDPSKAMIEILQRDARDAGLKINTITAPWNDAGLKPHDVIVCANVPQLLKEPRKFIEEATPLAKKAVFLIENADPNADKFYYKELYPLLFGKPFGERSDYIKTYNTLHDMGIFANVEIIDYDFDQPFIDLDEAVSFWKEYIGIVTEEHDAKLRGFLEKKLVKKKGMLFAKFRKKSAITWWRKGK